MHQQNKNLTRFWKSQLPSEKTLRSLAVVAQPNVGTEVSLDILRKRLYTGWDYNHIPYGHLTELGSQQLRDIGTVLNQRYVGTFLPSKPVRAVDYMYCRSTNLCRTMLSLRSFLSGFLLGNASDSSLLTNSKLPLIFSRLKNQETMYPHADGPCQGMTDRRLFLIHNKYNNATDLPAYASDLELKLIGALGLKEPLTWLMWLNIMDIMICYETHRVALPIGLTHDDVTNTVNFVSWVWGSLYKVILLCLHMRLRCRILTDGFIYYNVHCRSFLTPAY